MSTVPGEVHEVAMYAAKTGGSDAIVYDASIDKTSQQSLTLLSELRSAATGNQFLLYVMPKVDLRTGAISGVESLIRWQHPKRGMVFPDDFIPFAENTGFIRTLTQWMLDASVSLWRSLDDAGIGLQIAVNLSARDLLDHELPAKFAGAIARHGAPASSFCLEITESAIMDDPVRAQQTLEKLRELGFRLSIDDFGTGYSSLTYLKRLAVDELKIDKSFIMNMERDADDAKIVRSTVELGHTMGLKVVAEGLENAEVWNLLQRMNCDMAQGYFISKPMPAAQFPGWLANWTPKHDPIADPVRQKIFNH